MFCDVIGQLKSFSKFVKIWYFYKSIFCQLIHTPQNLKFVGYLSWLGGEKLKNLIFCCSSSHFENLWPLHPRVDHECCRLVGRLVRGVEFWNFRVHIQFHNLSTRFTRWYMTWQILFFGMVCQLSFIQYLGQNILEVSWFRNKSMQTFQHKSPTPPPHSFEYLHISKESFWISNSFSRNKCLVGKNIQSFNLSHSYVWG